MHQRINQKGNLKSILNQMKIKTQCIKCCQGLPWWYSRQESACQCRGNGFSFQSGRIPHAPEQLRPCATTPEPMLQSRCASTTKACSPGACAQQQEAIAMRSPCTAAKSSPHSLQLEKVSTLIKKNIKPNKTQYTRNRRGCPQLGKGHL